MNVPGCCDRFNRRAALYERHARLQRGLAWRLAHHIARLPLPPGPRADLGAGTGLVGKALRLQAPQPRRNILSFNVSLTGSNPRSGRV